MRRGPGSRHLGGGVEKQIMRVNLGGGLELQVPTSVTTNIQEVTTAMCANRTNKNVLGLCAYEQLKIKD